MILFVGLFLCAFGYAAFYLYDKQNKDYSLLSFRVENETKAVLVNDVDRLLGKIIYEPNALANFVPEEINSGLNYLTTYPDLSFNSEVCSRLFLSWNEVGFSITFDNSELTAARISNILEEKYQVENKIRNGQLGFEEMTFTVEEYGNFLVVSNTKVEIAKGQIEEPMGNPDFIVLSPDSTSVNHMLTKDYHFEVWRSDVEGYKSKGVGHKELFEKIPAEFDEIVFYGGSRFQEDLSIDFQSPDEELFSWIDQGLLLVKANDTMELIIGRQNEERDLRLILEEQTLEMQGDSTQLNLFNMGSFEVMYFETRSDWNKSIPELDQHLNYYTEYDNYNVLASSLSSMRWFLAEFQQDNFFLQNDDLKRIYEDAIPDQLNYLRIQSEGENYQITSRTNTSSSGVIMTSVTTGASELGESESIELLAEFPIEIIPTEIQVFPQSETFMYLVNNSTQLAMYMENGHKVWRLDLSTSLNQAPQLIDFENDGLKEFVLFQKDQIDVIGSHGKSKPGFPVALTGGSEGGIALNYDSANNYRLLVSNGKSVDCYNEDGKPVMGWMFKEMNAPLDGSIEYVQIAGKDYICFQDKGNNYYRLNRRGESRFSNDIKKDFVSETDFLIGENESNLRKLGFRNQHIYSYYIKDGSVDSSKVDMPVSPKRIFWRMKQNKVHMIVEESDRVLTFDEFGYRVSEIIKESSNQEILNVFGTQEFFYLFFDSYQNKLYLREASWQLLTGIPLKGSRTATLTLDRLITFVGNKIKVYNN